MMKMITKSEIITRATAAQHQASSPERSIWVSANAGTGKTRVLTWRVLRLLVDGADPAEILAITYTRTAATEMRNRIYESVTTWPYLEKAELINRLKAIGIASPSEKQINRARNLFAQLLDATAFLRIETIHAFCQSVLRRFPREAEVNPYFRVMEEDQSLKLKEDALISTLYQSMDKITDALERLALVRDVHDIIKLMRKMSAYPALLERANRDPVAVKQAIFDLMGCGDFAADPKQVLNLIDKLASPDAHLKKKLRQIITSFHDHGTKTEQRKASQLEAWLDADLTVRKDQIKTYLSVFLTGKGELLKNPATKSVIKAVPSITDIMSEIGEMLIDALAQIHAIDTAQNSFDLIQLARVEHDHYNSIKRLRGVMDYDDLINATSKLLTNASAAWVRYKLDQGIRYIMIDEAQDTSPRQWDIFDQLFEDQMNDQKDDPLKEQPARSVFSVGDYKQSIYSFQGARPDLFHAKAERVENDSKIFNRPFARIELDTSFRTVSPILTIVDHVTGAEGTLGPIPGIRGHMANPAMRHISSREHEDGWVHLDTLTSVEDGADIIDAHARRITEVIKQMIGKVAIADPDDPGQTRLAHAGDILVLLRKRDGLYEALYRQLQIEQIPLAGADRIKLMEDIACLDLLALGEVMLLPEDDLTLAAVLKSPLFGLSEDQLYHLARDRQKGESLFSRLRENPQQDEVVSTAYEKLLDYMGVFARTTAHGFYSEILNTETRLAFIRRQGQAVLDILDEFQERARRYEQDNTPSLLAFIDAMKTASAEIKRDDDDKNIQAVRIMTIHGAKGLEAPLVILPDAMQMRSPPQDLLEVESHDLGLKLPLFSASSRFLPIRATAVKEAKLAANEAEKEESHRLLYVAMTRAKDGLYVSGFLKRNSRSLAGSWYERLHFAMADALNPSAGESDKEEHYRNGGTAADMAQIGHQPMFYGKYTMPPSTKTIQDHDREQEPDDSIELPAWLTQSPPVEASPPRPLSPSRFSSPFEATSISGVDRKKAIRRGQIIHRLLEVLPGLSPDRQNAAAARVITANLSPFDKDEIDKDEAQAWLDEAKAVMDEPNLSALFTSEAFAELPIGGLVGNHVVSGIIDRLVITENTVIFADFKTGQVPDDMNSIPSSYLVQMGLYHRLLQDIFPDHRMKPSLIFTEGPSVFWLDPAQLEAAIKTIINNDMAAS
jgi:ATP-dependent helicase/nuclease subunit A